MGDVIRALRPAGRRTSVAIGSAPAETVAQTVAVGFASDANEAVKMVVSSQLAPVAQVDRAAVS